MSRLKFEISPETRLEKQRITKTLISLCGCAFVVRKLLNTGFLTSWANYNLIHLLPFIDPSRFSITGVQSSADTVM